MSRKVLLEVLLRRYKPHYLLIAGTQPGLQVQDINGTWHDVSCDIGSIAINTGDIKRGSNGYFPSTTHRVINPTSNKK